MRILTLTVITALALPFMALGQTTEPQQTQGQSNEPQTTAPTKGKKMKAPEQPTKPKAKTDTGTSVREQPNVKGQGRASEVNKTETDVNRNQPGPRSSTNETNVRSQTNVNQSTRVNVQEFKSRHSEVFNLGRHPKEFFVQKFGANHFRLIGNTYFAFVDSCWVAVDVDGFVYSERVICPGDPEFIEVE